MPSSDSTRHSPTQPNPLPSSGVNTATYDANPLPVQVATLECVRTGVAMPFTREEMSAINKTPIPEPVAVNYNGLLTDEQADKRHHGGHLKAVHQMPTQTYSKLNAAFDLKLEVGVLGENLTTRPIDGMPDMTEASVCIGDVYQYGEGEDSVQLRIVQPRRPCYKINDQIGVNVGKENIAAWVSRNGASGWYFQVVRDGMLDHELPVYLVERPYPFATLEKLWQLSNQKQKVDASVIQPWLDIDCLEQSWKKVLTKKIAS